VDWLTGEFPWSVRTAQRCMAAARLAEAFPALRDPALRIDPGAVHALAENNTPAIAVNRAIREAQRGKALSQARAQEIIVQTRQPKALRAQPVPDLEVAEAEWEPAAPEDDSTLVSVDPARGDDRHIERTIDTFMAPLDAGAPDELEDEDALDDEDLIDPSSTALTQPQLFALWSAGDWLLQQLAKGTVPGQDWPDETRRELMRACEAVRGQLREHREADETFRLSYDGVAREP
jgi:hypothetical protein